MADVSNVTAGKPNVGGAIWRAPLGTDLPTTATETLEAEFVELGYAAEGGVTNTNTPESEVIRTWGGDVGLVVQQTKDDTFKMTLIEALKADVLKAVYGSDNVSGTLDSGLAVNVNSDDAEEASWVIDMIMRGGVAKRIVIPDAKITELGDIVYADDSAVGYEITLTAMPDTDGNNHYEYLQSADSE